MSRLTSGQIRLDADRSLPGRLRRTVSSTRTDTKVTHGERNGQHVLASLSSEDILGTISQKLKQQQKELKSRSGSLASIKSDFNAVEGVHTLATEENRVLKAKIQRLITKCRLLEAQASVARDAQVSAMKKSTALEKSQSEKGDLESSYERVCEELRELKEKYTVVYDGMARETTRASNLESHYTSILTERDRTIETVSSEVARINGDNARLSTDLANAGARAVKAQEELESWKEKTSLTHAEQEAQIETLSAQLVESHRVHGVLQANVSDLKARTRQLESELNLHASAAQRLRQRRDGDKQTVLSSSSELERLRVMISDRDEQLREMSVAQGGLQVSNTQLSGDLRQARQEIKRLSLSLDHKSRELSDLTSCQTCDALRTDLQTWKAKAQVAGHEHGHLVRSLREQVATANDQIEYLRQENGNLQTRLLALTPRRASPVRDSIGVSPIKFSLQLDDPPATPRSPPSRTVIDRSTSPMHSRAPVDTAKSGQDQVDKATLVQYRQALKKVTAELDGLRLAVKERESRISHLDTGSASGVDVVEARSIALTLESEIGDCIAQTRQPLALLHRLIKCPSCESDQGSRMRNIPCGHVPCNNCQSSTTHCVVCDTTLTSQLHYNDLERPVAACAYDLVSDLSISMDDALARSKNRHRVWAVGAS